MECYLGGGFRRVTNWLSTNADARPAPTVSPIKYSFFNVDNHDDEVGDWHSVFIDFGLKFGLSF